MSKILYIKSLQRLIVMTNNNYYGEELPFIKKVWQEYLKF